MLEILQAEDSSKRRRPLRVVQAESACIVVCFCRLRTAIRTTKKDWRKTRRPLRVV